MTQGRTADGRFGTRTNLASHPVIHDIQNLLYSVKADVDEMKADLLWCVMILAKVTKEDPPSQAT